MRRRIRSSSADRFDFVASYQEQSTKLLEDSGDRVRALQAAIGADDEEGFIAIGQLQRALLVHAGLREDCSLVEIGCGSGRLAVQLRDWLRGPYVGTDVVPELIDHASTICQRPDWRFALVSGLTTPVETESADMVCAFSVFTHLLHEESYAYMEDIRRVLKPGGALVFSFLEFRVPSHWNVMVANLAHLGEHRVLNQFMSVDAVEVWSQRLGLEVLEINRGDDPYIPLEQPIELYGTLYESLGTFGQSAAILRKPIL
jgi:SAM-dependent methyltransferase